MNAFRCARLNACDDVGRSSLGVGYPPPEDRRHGRPRDAMTEIRQRTLDAAVTPARILGRHPYDQPPNLQEHAQPTRPAPAIRPLPGDALRVLAQNRIGRDERRNLRQKATAKRRAEGSQAPSFVVREA
jgi:hypothetical protein